MNRFILSFCLLMQVFLAGAQGQRNIWYFGDSAGVSFNIGSPVSLTDGTTISDEASASISDANGNLKFYANAWNSFINPNCYQLQVWNKNHQIMQNSAGIFGGYSMTQGVLLIPNPGDSNIYYLFSIAHSPFNNSLYYSVIDMTLDSGLGIVTQKNIVLCDSIVTEKLNAVKHANGRDFWIISHLHNSNNYLEYFLSPSGISGPYIFAIGPSIGTSSTATGGQLVFSQDGSKMCMGNTDGQLDLFSFDRCSGVITHTYTLSSNFVSGGKGWYGCSFSPDGNILYASNSGQLFQYNLNAPNILSSKITLITVNDSIKWIGEHLLGTDGKIYIARLGGVQDSTDQYLTLINSPDSLGASCGLSPFSFWLGGRKAKYGLPNLPNYSLGPLNGSICDSLSAGINEIANDNNITVYPNPTASQITIGHLPAGANEITVTVYDAIGKKKMQLDFSNIINGKVIMNVGYLPNGIYFYEMLMGGKDCYARGKFVITK